jgi:hypothetical protein
MNNSSGVKTFFEYLPESIKFHKLKNEGLARLIFVLVLFCQLIGNYAKYKYSQLISTEDIEKIYSSLSLFPSSGEIYQPSVHILYSILLVLGISLLAKLVTNLILSVYMYSFILEKRGKDGSFRESFKGLFRCFGRLIAYNIIFGILFLIGVMFFAVPGILAYVIFVFGYCYILDLKLTVPDAMTASSEITKGKKAKIAGIFVAYFILFKLTLFLVPGDTISGVFIGAFFSTITGMILQRLITKIYMDLEYNKEIARK